MPGIDAEIDREEFFRALAGHVLPLADRADRIGFCFSYPAEILPEKDGKLIQFTKEIKARGVEGQLIGANLSRALAAGRGPASREVVLLNDTVATLLAGRNAAPGRRFDDFIGIVCGTGLNAAYVERNALIRKLPGLDPAGSQIINTESGSFGGSPRRRGGRRVRRHHGEPREVPPREDDLGRVPRRPVPVRRQQRGARRLPVRRGRPGAVPAAVALSTRELNDFLLYPDEPRQPAGRGSARRLPPEDAPRPVRPLRHAGGARAALVAVTISGPAPEDRARAGTPATPSASPWTARPSGSFARSACGWSRGCARLLSGERARAWEITSVEDAPLLGRRHRRIDQLIPARILYWTPEDPHAEPSTDEMIARNYENAQEDLRPVGRRRGEGARDALAPIPLSLHCWQGDDVGGFESAAGCTGGGIQATGNYPGQGPHRGGAARGLRDGLFPDPREAHAPTSTPSTRRPAAGRWSATPLPPSTSPAGSPGQRSSASGWTSTRPTSATPWRSRASPFPPGTGRCGTSG